MHDSVRTAAMNQVNAALDHGRLGQWGRFFREAAFSLERAGAGTHVSSSGLGGLLTVADMAHISGVFRVRRIRDFW